MRKKIADPNDKEMPCIICETFFKINHDNNQDIVHQGFHDAVTCHTSGNYGSTLLDGQRISFIICDNCLYKHSRKILITNNIRQENARDVFEIWKDWVKNRKNE